MRMDNCKEPYNCQRCFSLNGRTAWRLVTILITFLSLGFRRCYTERPTMLKVFPYTKIDALRLEVDSFSNLESYLTHRLSPQKLGTVHCSAHSNSVAQKNGKNQFFWDGILLQTICKSGNKSYESLKNWELKYTILYFRRARSKPSFLWFSHYMKIVVGWLDGAEILQHSSWSNK